MESANARESIMSTVLFWFRNDLRLHDHPALQAACAAGHRHLLPVLCLPDAAKDSGWGFPRMGPHRRTWWASAVGSLRKGLESLGCPLLICRDPAAIALPALARAVGADTIMCEEIAAPDERAEVDALRAAGLTVHTVWHSSLLDPGRCQQPPVRSCQPGGAGRSLLRRATAVATTRRMAARCTTARMGRLPPAGLGGGGQRAFPDRARRPPHADGQPQTVAHGVFLPAHAAPMEAAPAHHIQRLMVVGNFALLAGLQPQALHRWYLGIYIDAFEWVELPNTVGMSQRADGGLIATKPYVSSAAYIQRMGDYCKGCAYDPRLKTGEKACPFNALYWDFFDRHQTRFERNPRLALVYRQLQKMPDTQREALRTQAGQLRDRIETL